MAKQGIKTKLRRLVVPKRLTVLLITVILLTVPIALYFTAYISSRTTYLTNRDFRQLASISEQLEERIDQLKDLFLKAIAQAAIDQSLENKKTSKTTINAANGQPQSKSLNEFFQKHLGKSLEAVTAKVAKGSEQKILDEIPKESESAPPVSIEVITGGETSTLYFVWTGPSGSFQAKAKLDDIINPFIGKPNIESRKGSEHREGFDAFLIASLENKNTNDQSQAAGTSRHSKVIFQQGSSDLDIDSLDNLARADVPDKMIDLGVLTENTTSADVQLAGTTYKIYSQPIEIPLRTTSSETTNEDKSKASGRRETSWVVCGLVQASHFRREAWAFPYTWLIFFVFVTVVVALSWPFLKLHFIGPKDRLKLADLYWIGFSLIVGSAILTFFMLFAVSYFRSEKVLDDQLEQFSSDINGRFHNEIGLILKELSDLKSLGPEDLKKTKPNNFVIIRPNERAPIPTPNNLRQAGDEKYPDVTRTNILIDKLPSEAPYPYFQNAVWMDGKGERRLEWTIDSTPSQGGFRGRDYFKQIIEGGSRGNPPDSKYWLEPVTSKLTYEKMVVVSSPTDSAPAADKTSVVILRDAAMMSLMHTVVPPGFGFRVIDSSGNDPSDDDWHEPGKVIFRSSESQQLKENFFEECDNDHSLRSLVFGRAADFTTVNYRGESHRLFIRPIEGFPTWSLVVFRNKQPLRTVYLEILTVAGFIFLFHAIFLLLPVTAYYIFKIRKHERTEWIWPTQPMAGAYRQTLLANLLLCIVSLAAMLGLLAFLGLEAERWRTVLLVSVIAFVGIVILALRLRLEWLLKNLDSAVNVFKLNTLINRGDAYIWNIVTLLILVGIMPAVTFYKFAYNEEMKLFAKHAQLSLAQGLTERADRVKRQYSTERADQDSNPSPFVPESDKAKQSSEQAKQFYERRLEKRNDVYSEVFFGTRVLPATTKGNDIPDPNRDLDSRLTKLVRTIPLFNETSVEMGGLTQGKATDKLWGWEKPIDNKLTFHPQLPGVENLQITTPLDRFGRAWRWWWVWMAAGFTAIVLILLVLSRFVVRRIFLLDVTQGLYLPTLSNDEIAQNVFLVRTSSFVTVNGGSNYSSSYYIDLATEASQNDWVRKLETRITSEQAVKTVVIDHFEFRMNDHACNDQKLRLVKTLLAANRSVVIKSSYLPSAFSFTGTARDGLKRHANDASNSWAEIMTRFTRVYEAKANEKVLDEAIENLDKALSETAPERKDKAIELAKRISNECAGYTWLADIGKGLIESLATKDVELNYIQEQIQDRAELCYQKLWDNCSNSEKLTLLHLAQDRLLSHNDPDIRPLMQRGLIVCAPDIRLMNETFKSFVLSECFLDIGESAEIRSAETQARKVSYLESFKIPVLVGFIGVVLFLFLTQRDLTSSPWTLVTAATTGIPAVFKILSFLQGDGIGQKFFRL